MAMLLTREREGKVTKMTVATCWLCDTEENIVNTHCAKCKKAYCRTCASKLEPAFYCDDCYKDVEIIEQTYERVTTDFDLKKEELVRHKASCKQIMYKGIDWMFHQKFLCTMSEEEQRTTLQMYKAEVTLLESELLEKSIRRTHDKVAMENVNGHRVMRVSKQQDTKTVKTAKVGQSDVDKLVSKIANLKQSDLDVLLALFAAKKGQ